ncbi:uncharacterized protein LOC110466695 [Mizuhopecten yessoensis]|uniref:uncharacterized protein LOC110466695 n=1 Tax=Mizuhopecten yessoensis TaxID=6573 RepID=UPI000B45E3AA|nr:uncharacterized protein LOC110466695 [Mizuhopecten yessoensis]
MSEFVAEAEVWKRTRKETIRKLNQLADELDLMQKRVNISNLTATSVSLATGIGSIVCFGLALVTGGISIIPGIVLGSIGLSGGFTTIGALAGKHFHEKDLLNKVQQCLDNDRRESERLNVLLDNTETLGKQINKYAKRGVKGARLIAGGIDFGAGIAANAVKGGTKAAVRTVSQVAGAVGLGLDLLILPLDIYFLVETSIKTHQGSTHEAAVKVRTVAADLEKEKDAFLVRQTIHFTQSRTIAVRYKGSLKTITDGKE